MDISFKVITAFWAICFGIGTVIYYFTGFHWLTASLIIMCALLFNGFAISVEDNSPGGIDHNPDKTEEERASFKKMPRIQGFSVILVFILSLISYVYNHS